MLGVEIAACVDTFGLCMLTKGFLILPLGMYTFKDITLSEMQAALFLVSVVIK